MKFKRRIFAPLAAIGLAVSAGVAAAAPAEAYTGYAVCVLDSGVAGAPPTIYKQYFETRTSDSKVRLREAQLHVTASSSGYWLPSGNSQMWVNGANHPTELSQVWRIAISYPNGLWSGSIFFGDAGYGSNTRSTLNPVSSGTGWYAKSALYGRVSMLTDQYRVWDGIAYATGTHC